MVVVPCAGTKLELSQQSLTERRQGATGSGSGSSPVIIATSGHAHDQRIDSCPGGDLVVVAKVSEDGEVEESAESTGKAGHEFRARCLGAGAATDITLEDMVATCTGKC